MKNNVTRLLDQNKIDFTVFELPDERLGASGIANRLGVPLDIIFKTIVVKRDGLGKPILAVVPGDREVDLKLLAKFVGEKKVFLLTLKEAEMLTRLKAGGISPLALINRGFQVVIDRSALKHGFIHVSGGQRGMNIRLHIDDIIKLTNARLAEISRPG